jgi:hypothetical protein
MWSLCILKKKSRHPLALSKPSLDFARLLSYMDWEIDLGYVIVTS